MKKFIWIVCFVCISQLLHSQKPFQATLYFTDGSVRTGFAELVNTFESKFVFFREDANSKTEKIPSVQIKRIVYDNGDEVHEYDCLKVFFGINKKKPKGPFFLKLLQRGYASLYMIKTYMTATNGHVVSFDDYYIIREGESGAKLISSVGALNKNNIFRSRAPKYFSDHKELALQIKKKKYKWNDIEQVVKIYNEWIADKSN